MAKIRFLSRQSPRTGRPEGDPVYEAGETYDLRDDQARKWVNRHVAEYVSVSEKGLRETATAVHKAPAVDVTRTDQSKTAGLATVARHGASGLSKQAEARAMRGTNLDDEGTDAPRPPNAMTTADLAAPPTSAGSGGLRARFEAGEDLNRDLLIELAGELGVELPSGYNPKDDLRAAVTRRLKSRSGA